MNAVLPTAAAVLTVLTWVLFSLLGPPEAYVWDDKLAGHGTSRMITGMWVSSGLDECWDLTEPIEARGPPSRSCSALANKEAVVVLSHLRAPQH